MLAAKLLFHLIFVSLTQSLCLSLYSDPACLYMLPGFLVSALHTMQILLLYA